MLSLARVTQKAPPGAASHKSWRLLPQVLLDPPEQLLGHRGRTLPVGIGKPVAAGGGRAAHARQRARVQLQRIAQVIETDAMRQLGIDQADHVTPRLETARLILGPGSPRYFGNLVRRNKIANLAQDVELRPCWVDRFIFHPCLVAGPKRQPCLLYTSDA